MSLHGIFWSGSLFAAFRPFRCGSKKKCITVEQFVEFLNRHQRDPRLNEILYPYANPDRARDLFHQYEPSKANSQKGLSVSVWSTQDWCVHCPVCLLKRFNERRRISAFLAERRQSDRIGRQIWSQPRYGAAHVSLLHQFVAQHIFNRWLESTIGKVVLRVLSGSLSVLVLFHPQGISLPASLRWRSIGRRFWVDAVVLSWIFGTARTRIPSFTTATPSFRKSQPKYG